jgi:hypothetical protein
MDSYFFISLTIILYFIIKEINQILLFHPRDRSSISLLSGQLKKKDKRELLKVYK